MIFLDRFGIYEPRELEEYRLRLLAREPVSEDAGGNANSYMEIRFSNLGAAKTVRWVVVGALVPVGTMESIFWVKVVVVKMRWRGGGGEWERRG